MRFIKKAILVLILSFVIFITIKYGIGEISNIYKSSGNEISRSIEIMNKFKDDIYSKKEDDPIFHYRESLRGMAQITPFFYKSLSVNRNVLTRKIRLFFIIIVFLVLIFVNKFFVRRIY